MSHDLLLGAPVRRRVADETARGLRRPLVLRSVAAIVLLAAAGSLAGCASDKADQADEAQTPASTPRVTAADRKCHSRQVGGLGRFNVNDPIQDLTQDVLASADRAPSREVTRLQAAVERISDRTNRDCRADPATFVALRDAVAALDPQHVDEPQLRELVSSFEAWGRTLGHAHDMQIIYGADPCAAARNQVQAHYSVRYQPEPEGKRASVLLTLVNNWSHPLYVEYGGQALATGLRTSPATRTLHWGGSSADSTGSALPGRTVREVVWPTESGRTPWLHLDPAGAISVMDGSNGWVWAEDAGGFDGCSLPIPPAPRSSG